MANLTPEELDDQPLTLAEACTLIFKDAIKPATLRAEAARGRLVIERIGRRQFVTRKALREMRELCRVPASPPPPPIAPRVDMTEEMARANAALTYALKNHRQGKPKP